MCHETGHETEFFWRRMAEVGKANSVRGRLFPKRHMHFLLVRTFCIRVTTNIVPKRTHTKTLFPNADMRMIQLS